MPLGNYSSHAEAAVAQTKLASEGIPAQIPAYYSRYRALGGWGIYVYVHPDDAERATDVLQLGKTWIDMDEYVEADDTSVPRCPSCGSASVERERLPPRRWFVSLFLAGIPLLFYERHWHCHKCAHTWNRKILQVT